MQGRRVALTKAIRVQRQDELTIHGPGRIDGSGHSVFQIEGNGQGLLLRDLDLRQPKYNVTAAYCHFGRQPYTENGIRYFAWEDPIDLSSYAGMTTAQIEKEVAANKAAILAKWVD